MSEKNPNTTAIINDLFGTLKRYSQSQQVSEADILRKRARQYAEVDDARSVGNTRTLLLFDIDGTLYGVDVMFVREIREIPSVTRVPGTGDYFRGVVNVRGVVTTLLDLVVFLGGGRTENMQEMLLVASNDVSLGIAVSQVVGVEAIGVDEVRVVDEAIYTEGMVDVDHKSTLLLDFTRILTDERLFPGMPQEKVNGR
jgi:purine-binding chemotaxis protein CheW